MEISIKDIEQNLKSLPEFLLEDVNNFVKFLKSKYDNEVPDWQKDEVLRRKELALKSPESIIGEGEMLAYLSQLDNES